MEITHMEYLELVTQAVAMWSREGGAGGIHVQGGGEVPERLLDWFRVSQEDGLVRYALRVGPVMEQEDGPPWCPAWMEYHLEVPLPSRAERPIRVSMGLAIDGDAVDGVLGAERSMFLVEMLGMCRVLLGGLEMLQEKVHVVPGWELPLAPEVAQ